MFEDTLVQELLDQDRDRGNDAVLGQNAENAKHLGQMLLQPDGGKSREGGLEDPLVLNVKEVGMLFFGGGGTGGSCGQKGTRQKHDKGEKQAKGKTKKNNREKSVPQMDRPTATSSFYNGRPTAYSFYKYLPISLPDCII